MVIKNYLFILIILFLLFSKSLFSSQIYDYQTEKLLENISSKILSVNSYNKKINFKIINDPFPNAFVNQNNTLFLSSGLLIHSPDYVALLAVIAHEIGHIEKYHVSKRIIEIDDLKNYNSLSNLAAIAGSMIIQQPELMNAVLFNKTAINNIYLNFSQDQEKEADLYAVETLNKLKLPTDSVKEFLSILENKSKFNLLDDELKKFSTHPLFQERYEIIDNKKRKNSNNFDEDLQNEFNFIKAKFMAYTGFDYSKELEGDEKIYYQAIQNSLSGNLSKSLKKLNILISKHRNNFFIVETKADILLSYGYNKEAIEFYKIVIKNYPKNNYAKFNIFLNTNYNDNEKIYLEELFFKNINLISLFPNNKVLITKLYKLSKIVESPHWITFFEILLFEKKDLKKKFIKLQKKTEDNNLKKIIKLYI